MDPLIDTVLEIDTPEHVAFRTRIAGPGRRMFAWLLDLLVRVVVLIAAWAIIQASFGSVDLDGIGAGFMFLGRFLLEWGYFFVCEMLTGGRSPGKVVLRLRVVRADGRPLTWRESSLRNLLRAADLLLFPPSYLAIGPLVMALDPRFRRIGDFAAGTIVVVEDTTRATREPPIPADPQVVAELPTALTLDRADLEALDLFVHRAHMSTERREELAEIVAPYFAERLGVPRPKSAAAFLAALWVHAQDPQRKKAA